MKRKGNHYERVHGGRRRAGRGLNERYATLDRALAMLR